MKQSNSFHLGRLCHNVIAIEKLQSYLKEFGDIVIGFGRGFHKRNIPTGGLSLSFDFRYLTHFGALIAFIAHQHYGNIAYIRSLQAHNFSSSFANAYCIILYKVLKGIWYLDTDKWIKEYGILNFTFNSLIKFQINLSSSRLCLEQTEYTRIKACPLVMESLCMAGNWCEPVVSVICRVQIFLLQLIT